MMENKIDTCGKTKMSVQARSQGDGMEMVVSSENTTEKMNLSFKTSISSSAQNRSTGFNASLAGKKKEPKFIPYEPYKAAVSPIIPKGIEKHKDKIVTHNYCNPKLPAKQFISTSAENIIRPNCTVLNSQKNENVYVPLSFNSEQTKEVNDVTWLAEKLVLENTVQQLQMEKKDLETQFKIQTKVNADLKKLLVASLGEDMQVKVQYMSEDKAKLGEHVLLYSEKLSKNNEELERLTAECAMWKSKAQASKLIIDELTAWKAVLSRKLNESTDAIQYLLNENKEIYSQSEGSMWTLHCIQEAFDPSAKRNAPCSETPWNLIQLVGATNGLCHDIQTRLLGGSIFCKNAHKFNINQGLTLAEQKAQKVISSIEELPLLAEEEIKGKQLDETKYHTCSSYLRCNAPKEATVNCCKYCSGEVRLV